MPTTLFWRSAGEVFARIVTLVPRRHRFAWALIVARLLTVVVRRMPVRSEEREKLMETPLDTALHLTTERLRRRDIALDPPMRIEGFSILQAARERGQGVLLIARHGAGTRGIIPELLELGGIMIAAYPETIPCPVTPEKRRVLQPSPLLFVRTRTFFRAGELVCAMLDRWGPMRPGDREFLTPHGGPIVVSDALIRCAVRCGAAVLFVAGHADRDGLVMTIGAPRETSHSADAITRDFILFVQDDMRQVRAHWSASVETETSAVDPPATRSAATSVVAPPAAAARIE